MTEASATRAGLSRRILDDIFRNVSGSRAWVRSLLEPLVRPSVGRFSRLAVQFDEMVARSGFRESVRQLLSVFASNVRYAGREWIPETGPLVLVSNHPGSCDSLAIAASVPRDDLQIVASGFDLLRALPHTSQHPIFPNLMGRSSDNLSVLRSGIRHLQVGGAVLIFPAGRVEPDPSIGKGAAGLFSGWLSSVELFLRKLADVRLQVAIVSGAVRPSIARSPLLRMWKEANPNALAGILQTALEMLQHHWLRLQPAVSFGVPKTIKDLRAEHESVSSAIGHEARSLPARHRSTYLLDAGVSMEPMAVGR